MPASHCIHLKPLNVHIRSSPMDHLPWKKNFPGQKGLKIFYYRNILFRPQNRLNIWEFLEVYIVPLRGARLYLQSLYIAIARSFHGWKLLRALWWIGGWQWMGKRAHRISTWLNGIKISQGSHIRMQGFSLLFALTMTYIHTYINEITHSTQ